MSANFVNLTAAEVEEFEQAEVWAEEAAAAVAALQAAASYALRFPSEEATAALAAARVAVYGEHFTNSSPEEEDEDCARAEAWADEAAAEVVAAAA
jgi:hypothetical protein